MGDKGFFYGISFAAQAFIDIFLKFRKIFSGDFFPGKKFLGMGQNIFLICGIGKKFLQHINPRVFGISDVFSRSCGFRHALFRAGVIFSRDK